MKFTINTLLKLSLALFVVSALYLLISLFGFIDLGYQQNHGNSFLFSLSLTSSILWFCLTVALLVVKLMRSVKK